LAYVIGVSQQIEAEAVYGGIGGVVTDPAGEALANADVTIRDLDRNIAFTTGVNENGNFGQRHIAGRYQVEVEASGFRTEIENNINLTTETQVRVDLTMQIEDVNQSVEAIEEAAQRKTERSDVAGNSGNVGRNSLRGP
jgi:hypothetical protein